MKRLFAKFLRSEAGMVRPRILAAGGIAATAITLVAIVTGGGGGTPGLNCMPNPSACGFPDTTNTGTLPGVARDTVSGTITLSTPGQVYANHTLTGGIIVTAANVTISNVKIIKNVGWAIRCRPQDGACSNLTINDSEINLNGDFGGYGIVCENYTGNRLFIHNGADGAYFCNNATLNDSLVALGPDLNDDGWADSNTYCTPTTEHFDALSTDGGSNQVYNHNTLRNPCTQTSAILISTNSGAVSNVRITNNLMAGGGFTLYCNAGPVVTGGEVVTGNRIAKSYFDGTNGDPGNPLGGGYYGPTANCGGASMTYSNNVWDADGSAL